MKNTISTKHTQKNFLLKSILLGILCFIIFILLCCIGANLIPASSNYSDDLDPMTLMSALCGIMALVMPAVLIFSAVKYSKTYVEINEHTISGQGMEMINGSREGGVSYFNMNLSEVKNITFKSKWLTLYTETITYKILTDKNTAIKIYNFYKKNK